jgi:peroxiredoxin
VKGAFNVKTKTYTILAISILMTMAIGCSGSSSPTNCPEMGNITSVDNSGPCLTQDTRIGSKAPNFTWSTIDCQSLEPIAGKTMSLNGLQSKPVMIIFHKTMNCPGCKAQMPFIRAAYDQRTNKNLIVLTIYRGDSTADVKRFVLSQGYIFPALADPDDAFAANCGFPIGAPITIFVDANGTIKAEKVGPFQSQEEITSMFDKL